MRRRYKGIKGGMLDASYAGGVGQAWLVLDEPFGKEKGVLKHDENGWTYWDLEKQNIIKKEGYIIYELIKETDPPEEIKTIYVVDEYISHTGLTYEGKIFVPKDLYERLQFTTWIRLDWPLALRSTDDQILFIYDRPTNRYWLVLIEDYSKCPRTRLFEVHEISGRIEVEEYEVGVAIVNGKRIPLVKGDWYSIIHEDDNVLILNNRNYYQVMVEKNQGE